MQIMHKVFNVWRMAPASGDLRNIELSKLAAFCQLSTAVPRGGVALIQPF